MATIIYAGRIEKGRQYVELAGLSTETKPTRGILNGSKFHELDTTKIHAYDQVNDLWRFQMQLGEPEESTGSSQLGGSLGGGFGGLGGNGGTYQGGQDEPEQPDDQEQEGDPEEPVEEETPEDGENA